MWALYVGWKCVGRTFTPPGGESGETLASEGGGGALKIPDSWWSVDRPYAGLTPEVVENEGETPVQPGICMKTKEEQEDVRRRLSYQQSALSEYPDWPHPATRHLALHCT